MISVGFIHFDCLCGLDIYFFGDLPGGKPPYEAIETFRVRLGKAKHAIFTSCDESIVPCPCCESNIQLPSPQVTAFLGSMSLASSIDGKGKRAKEDDLESRQHKKLSDGVNYQLSKLN